MMCLGGVMFPVWVHGYVVWMWHPFVCGVLRCLLSSASFHTWLLACLGATFSRPALCRVCDGRASWWVFFCQCSCFACSFAQHELSQVPIGCCTTFLAASACPTPAPEAWVRQPSFPLRSQCFSCAGWLADDRWAPHPVRLTSWDVISSFCGWFCKRGSDCSLCCGVLGQQEFFRLWL